MIIHIDFETYSRCDLKKRGAWVYSEDCSTGLFCMAYTWEGLGSVQLWTPGDKLPSEFDAPDAVYVARNALFEHAMCANVAVPRYGFPERMTRADVWVCTRALSVAVGMPGSLGECAKALNVSQKLNTGIGLINKYSKPIRAGGEFRPLVGEDRDLMYEYCRADVQADFECYNKLKNLETNHRETGAFSLDFEQNIKGLPVDVDSLYKVQAELTKAYELAELEAKKYGINIRSPKQLQNYLRERGVRVDDCKVETIKETSEIPCLSGDVYAVLELRLFLAKASVKKFQSMIDRVSEDGFLRHSLLYFGAGTGRWSGRGFQPHNLPRTKTKPEKIAGMIEAFDGSEGDRKALIDTAKRILPGLICAEAGKSFIMGDFAAIEARGLAFLAGENTLIKQFKNGEDVYISTAATLFNKPASAISKEGFERQLGKKVILASSYGMGASKFFQTCQKDGLTVSPELAEHAIKMFRGMYPKIPTFWRNLETAFSNCYVGRKQKFTCKVGSYVSVRGANNYVAIRLPSGRELYYHDVKQDERGLSYFNHSRKARVYLYGGILAENVTQAVCRDLLVECMIDMKNHGLSPLFHVHDEIICYEPDDLVEFGAKIFERITNAPPSWFVGFPMKTEIEICKRYHK